VDPSDLLVDAATAPLPDLSAEPDGFVVLVEPADRIHFLDWGGPADTPGILLVHGIGATAWTWAPVARRLRRVRRVVAMDLRGHGLSDSPTEGFEPDVLAGDVIAVAEGAGLLSDGERVVLAGHGFGAIASAWAAAVLGDRCAGLVLVDGGLEDVAAATELEPDELLRDLDEPPEVLRSMAAFLSDRAAFDPATWDADQERAARASVVELPAGRVVPVTRPHVLAGVVEAMFAYRPGIVLPSIEAPITALLAADDEGSRASALADAQAMLAAAGRSRIRVASFPADAHNLMRYRPAEVAGAILAGG
jgi:pimeloyl-ACP methyl ester carboxylesterase